MDARFLITTAPENILCGHCRCIVLNGLEAGMPYRVDPIPITPAGEMAALAQGHLTYWIVARHLAHRSIADIRADTERPRPLVMRTHRCQPINPRHIDTPKAPEMLAYLHRDTATRRPPQERIPF